MSSDRDIYQILESLDAAQKSVKQLPALFKPANTSPQIGGKYPGRNATQGYLVGEDKYDYENPMAQAVTRRIVNQHPEWIMKYGVDALTQAIDDVVGDRWDGDEIGSSDVSAYVQMVSDQLRDRMGDRSEMDDRKPFAEDDDEQEQAELNSDGEPDHGLFGDDEDKDEAEQVDELDKKTLASYVKKAAPDRYNRIPNDLMKMKDPEKNRRQWVTREKGIDQALDKLSRESVSEADGDQVKKVFKRAGKPVGEVGIDPDHSPGQGEWYIKHYASGTDLSGYDSYEEAVEELREFVRQGISEGRESATEDVLSTMKKKLGDYLQDVATAIRKDPDLVDKIPQDVDKISAVKTIRTDDGHEIKIHGTEDDGFRISIKNRDLKSRFKDLDEAVMACEMYCARRRTALENADYIEEKR
jgi:hypothetical protein